MCMSKQSAMTRSNSTKETQEEVVEIDSKSTTQAPEWHHWHYSVVTFANLIPNLHLTAVSTFSLQTDKCRHSTYFLALEIKQNLRILTVKKISQGQSKLTYPEFDTKSLQSLKSRPSGSHLLILFLKSSRLFKFFISIGIICQTSEAKNLLNSDHICYYLQNF